MANMKNAKSKKAVVSFAVDPKVKVELQKKQGYTQHIAALVEHSLGFCPVCHSKVSGESEPKDPTSKD